MRGLEKCKGVWEGVLGALNINISLSRGINSSVKSHREPRTNDFQVFKVRENNANLSCVLSFSQFFTCLTQGSVSRKCYYFMKTVQLGRMHDTSIKGLHILAIPAVIPAADVEAGILSVLNISA